MMFGLSTFALGISGVDTNKPETAIRAEDPGVASQRGKIV
jgi:hypothetical protein